ncbi:MAG: GyrI-like domain-containing protein [Anaerolineaceae bacterium]|nr:GyrI-like domain-containing protein [Anaerolineaceae bacterium]
MKPEFIEKEAMIMAGFSFYGTPFEFKDFWDEQNEIGKLWQRFMGFIQQVDTETYPILRNLKAFYEIHIDTPETLVNGVFEVFVGTQIPFLDDLPLELVIKVLPAIEYAVFTLKGEEITSDWPQLIYDQWMPQNGYELAYPFNFQYYDHRFKGMDKISESTIDVFVPIRKII